MVGTSECVYLHARRLCKLPVHGEIFTHFSRKIFDVTYVNRYVCDIAHLLLHSANNIVEMSAGMCFLALNRKDQSV